MGCPMGRNQHRQGYQERVPCPSLVVLGLGPPPETRLHVGPLAEPTVQGDGHETEVSVMPVVLEINAKTLWVNSIA